MNLLVSKYTNFVIENYTFTTLFTLQFSKECCNSGYDNKNKLSHIYLQIA